MRFESFSQRNKYKNIDNTLQIKKMNSELRNGLWSCLIDFINEIFTYETRSRAFMRDLYIFFWKQPIDTIPGYRDGNISLLRERYFNNYNWHEVYDFIEFFCFYFKKYDMQTNFQEEINNVLERENSGYRLLEGCIVKIIDKSEIASLKETFDNSSETNIKVHFDNALKLLSDKVNPDFRNSIKESISAVECICREITGENTLDNALPKLVNKGIEIPAVLKDGMKKMYYWTNGTSGIRHALMDETLNLSFDEAKYMLVVCSAFVNYIISKFSKVKSNDK